MQCTHVPLGYGTVLMPYFADTRTFAELQKQMICNMRLTGGYQCRYQCRKCIWSSPREHADKK